MDFINEMKFLKYAKTQLPNKDEEAEKLYKRYKSIDPFPDIEPALLNSADIFRYIVATGMIFPFNLDEENFRGATYSASLCGECMYWDENGIQKIKYIKKENDSIILEPSSITFVTLEPYFRIPEYIFLRFNLKISHVYKGLLLGTGPIVDPGYNGYLSIPLHNLTLNKYLESLKFTKLMRHCRVCLSILPCFWT